jgi:hypothetical protein
MPDPDSKLPILCIDFDGVIHRYSKGCQGGKIYDPPTEGFFDWAARAQKHFRLVIYSSRSNEDEGRLAMGQWLVDHLHKWGGEVIAFEIAASKPPAWLTIDDRALTFTGDWLDFPPERLLAFKPWTQT